MTEEQMIQPAQLDDDLLETLRSDKRPHKQIFIDRIQGRAVDRLPYWEVIIESSILAAVLDRPFPANATSGKLPPEDLVELACRTGMSGMGMALYYSPCRRDKSLQTRAGFEELQRQGPPDYTGRFERLRALQEAAKGTDIGVWAYVHGPLDPIYLGMELETFWLLTMDDPRFLREVGDYLLEVNLDLARQIVALGADWLHIADDVAFKSGLLVRPDFFFDYYPDRLEKLMAPAKEAGIPVTYHSDGKVDEIVDMLIECGVDGLNPVEPHSNDIFEIGERAGDRIGIIGNVELARMVPDEAYTYTRELIDRMGSRYVPASSHSVTRDVAPATYAAFLRAIHERAP
jgi:hypothetical protein